MTDVFHQRRGSLTGRPDCVIDVAVQAGRQEQQLTGIQILSRRIDGRQVQAPDEVTVVGLELLQTPPVAVFGVLVAVQPQEGVPRGVAGPVGGDGRSMEEPRPLTGRTVVDVVLRRRIPVPVPPGRSLLGPYAVVDPRVGVRRIQSVHHQGGEAPPAIPGIDLEDADLHRLVFGVGVVGDTPGLGTVVDGDHLPARPPVRRVALPARQPQRHPLQAAHVIPRPASRASTRAPGVRTPPASEPRRCPGGRTAAARTPAPPPA